MRITITRIRIISSVPLIAALLCLPGAIAPSAIAAAASAEQAVMTRLRPSTTNRRAATPAMPSVGGLSIAPSLTVLRTG